MFLCSIRPGFVPWTEPRVPPVGAIAGRGCEFRYRD